MPLVISGKLSLPVTGRPAANAEIRFRAVNSVGEIIQGAESLDRCDASGNYNISLEFARYEIATKISTVDFIVHGQVTIDIDTIASDLESLIEQIGLAGELTDELIKEFQQLKAEAVTAANEAKQSASEAAADAKTASDAEAAVTPMYNYFNANYPTFETNYQDFAVKYPDVVQKHAEVVTLEGQAQTAKDLAEKWASNPENVPVTGSEYSAFHWAEKAKQNANQTFVSGGLFTPATGNEYPDVSGVSRDTIWIMEFSAHGETYTFTSGQLSGKTTGNGDMLFYDTPTNVWSLIPTAVAAGIISVDGDTGPSVNLESKYYWSGNKPAIADVAGLQSELDSKTTESDVADKIKSDLPLYTDVVYKASGGSSAVEAMMADFALNYASKSIGDIISTGGTRYQYTDSTAPITDDNFRVFNAYNVFDFESTSRTDVQAIQATFNAAGEGGEAYIPNNPKGYWSIDSTLNVPSRIKIQGAGWDTVLKVESAVYCLNLDSVLYATLSDFRIELSVKNAKAMIIQSTGPSFSQLNKFYNINVEGGNIAGAVGLVLSNTWSNQFYSCNIFRCTALTFGQPGDTANTVNANHFYGCEIRGINSNTEHRPVNQRVGDNNGFFGGIIENWGKEIVVGGGTFFLKGVYVEGFSTGRSIRQTGGSLIVDGCFRGTSVDFIAGKSLSYTNNQILDTSGAYKTSYPFISVSSDTDAFFTITGNHLDGDSDGVDFYLYREGEYLKDGVSWEKRTSIKEDVSWLPSKFSVRLASDLSNVVGDETTPYKIAFGNNEEFDYGNEIGSSGDFIPKQNGVYQFSCGVLLGGLEVGSRISLTVSTTDRTYYLGRHEIASLNELIGDTIQITGSCLAHMSLNDNAHVSVIVSNSSGKVVSVLRGDATNGYTFFSGVKV